MIKGLQFSILCVSTVLMLSFASPVSAQISDSRVNFTIGFQGVRSDLNTLMATVMPSGILKIETDAVPSAFAGDISKTGRLVSWLAPAEPGRHELKFLKDGEEIILHVFVLTPFKNAETESLNGYKIGQYRKTLFKGLQSYAEPKGFIDLSHGPGDLNVSPNFTLRQFICKQQPGHDPTYLLVNPATLIKLETLLEAANRRGWKADTLHVMSGFRTPHYNRSIGNKTTSSRHLYGGAADVWLDGDGDGQMDDLNKDGTVDKNDARELAKLAETLAIRGGRNWPAAGGIGVYGANAAHGPFIHIDSRGYRARWGH